VDTSDSSQITASVRRRFKLWAGLALLLVCAVYANSFENQFHFDDFHTITDNPAIRRLGNVPRFFRDVSTFSVLPANRTYRPIVSASLAFDYALGHGYVPFWFHLSTFLWFVVLLALLYLLYAGVMDNIEPEGAWPRMQNAALALATAAWFGVHPAMVETVNYIIQRGDIFCTLGCVAALVVWARYPELRNTGLYLLPLVFALLSKPPAAVFPVLLLAYVYFFEAPAGRGRWRRSLVAMIPSTAVTVAGLWLQSAMTPKTFAPSILAAGDYRLTQPYVWLRYFLALFLPIHLNVDSDLVAFSGVNGRALLGFFFVLAIVAAIAVTARRKSLYPIAFGLIWFVVTQLPTSAYALSELENDHRMFFSFPGLMLAVVWAGWVGVRAFLPVATLPRRRPVLVACTLLMLTGYAWGAHRRNQVWRTEETLWLDDVQKSPHNGRGLMIYGLTQMNKGAYPEALRYFERALVYTPNYATLEINLGVVNGAMQRNDEAEAHLLRAIALTPNDDLPHAYYGRWLLGVDRVDESVAQIETAIALNPQRPLQRDLLLAALSRKGDIDALRVAAAETLRVIPGDPAALAIVEHPEGSVAIDAVNRSLALYREGRYRESIESAKRALVFDPKRAEAYNNIGAAYGAMGQWDDAIAAESKALEINPDLQIAKNNLVMFADKKREGAEAAPIPTNAAEWVNRSLALNQTGKFEQSIAAARSALALDPRSAEAWNNIAANYEAMHRWDEAIDAAGKAIAIRPDFQLAKNNLAWSVSQKKLARTP